jgi:hypothetical protein
MKKTRVFMPILWTVVTIIWIISLCINIATYKSSRDMLSIILQSVCVLASGAAAVVNFINYKRSRTDDK